MGSNKSQSRKPFALKGLSQKAIATKVLETIPFSGLKKEISYETNEWTMICPVTKLGDFGTILIRYTPREKIAEIVSLEHYLYSFRPVSMFQEEAVDRVYRDIWNLLDPESLLVRVTHASGTGSMSSTVEINSLRLAPRS